MRTLIILLGVLSLPAGIGLQSATAGSVTAPASVDINSTCGFAITGGTGLAFLALDVGETTTNVDERTVVGTNTGNEDVDVELTANHWQGTNPVQADIMLSERTRVALSPAQDYDTGMTGVPTTGTGDTPFTVATALTPQSDVTSHFKLRIILEPAAAGFEGTGGQTDTFAFNCP